MGHVIAVDLGGTKTRVALVNGEAISLYQSIPTMAHKGQDVVLNRLTKLLWDIRSKLNGSPITGIAVSVASPVNAITGEMYNPPNLPWNTFNLKPVLQKELDLPVWVGNDGNLAALGEYLYGAGQGYRHMIYITVSTGIGGGIIINGSLYLGANGFSGEVGHMTIEQNGPVCPCGNRGCLEVLASGTAIAQMAQDRIAAGDSTLLSEKSEGNPNHINAQMVAEAARSGDNLARLIFSQAADNLGVGVVNLIHAFNPEVIVLGGGVSENFDFLSEGIEKQIRKRSMNQFNTTKVGSTDIKYQPILVKSLLGENSGLLGAAAMASASLGY